MVRGSSVEGVLKWMMQGQESISKERSKGGISIKANCLQQRGERGKGGSEAARGKGEREGHSGS